jgi:hypothetical protein
VITAATISTASLIAVVVLVTTAGIPNAAPDYVQTPTPTPSMSTTSTPAPSAPPTTNPPTTPPTSAPAQPPILGGLLLTVDDVAEQTTGGALGYTWVSDDGASDAQCAPDVGVAATETEHVRYVARRLGFDQWAEAFPTTSAATERLADIRAFFGDCAEQAGDEVDLFEAYTLSGVGDAGFVAVMKQPLNVDEQLYLELSASATGRVVTWVISTGPGQDYSRVPSARQISTAVDRLCVAAEGECSGDPVLNQTYPEDVAGLTAGLLTTDDVGGVLSGEWSQYVEPYGTLLLSCAGPESEAGASASYSRHDVEDELSVSQTVVIFSTEPVATAALDAVVGCLTVHPDYVVLDGVALAWRASWGAVVAVRQDGRRVTILSVSDAGLGLPPVESAVVESLVSRIEARLAEAG